MGISLEDFKEAKLSHFTIRICTNYANIDDRFIIENGYQYIRDNDGVETAHEHRIEGTDLIEILEKLVEHCKKLAAGKKG